MSMSTNYNAMRYPTTSSWKIADQESIAPTDLVKADEQRLEANDVKISMDTTSKAEASAIDSASKKKNGEKKEMNMV